ncbi:hypothetical protein GQX74_009578 [Glossina fuscipes]|nr:hypothetical protein GQX74_009578 [Glossina fuscipes]
MQKFTSCHELLSQSAELSTSGYEFHISEEELVECCNKAEDTMKEVKNIDAPEEDHDDNKKETIVDIIFEDFSTSPFNSPVVSPEGKLKNLERSPLFILREKPKKNYSREFREKAKLSLLYDPTPERKASDQGSVDIEKKDTYDVIQTLTPSNQCKTEISNNYGWNDDDDDIIASISTQEILHQDVKMNNNFRHTSKFPVNKQITQGMALIFLTFYYAYYFTIILIGFKGNQRDNISGYSKNLVLTEINVALGLQKASGERPELGEGKNAVGLSEISIENESEEVKSKVNRDEVGKVNNPESSLVSAGFKTANGKKISILKKSQTSVQNILREFQDILQEKNYKTELKDIKARMSIKSMESKPPQLCETPNRNTRQTETTTPELGEFINNAVETSTPGVDRPKR